MSLSNNNKQQQFAATRIQRNLLTSSILLAMLPLAAIAQDAPASQGEGAAQQLDRIVVTGSRIARAPRAGFDTLEPAQVVERETFETLGITNAAEALFRQPAFNAGSSYRGAQAGYGAGVNFASRFGLGSQRELTLVNGRRMVSSNPSTNFGPGAPGQQVDLNVIPTALIERVETIGIGGAPTYGSDAISGVTNVILRRDFEGVELNMGIGSTIYGDNIRLNRSSTFGKNFADDRGNFTVTLSLDRNDGVLSSERDFYRQGWGFSTNPSASSMAAWQPGRNPATDGRYNTNIPFDGGSSDGVPGAVLIRDIRLPQMTWGGLLFPNYDTDNRLARRLPLGRKDESLQLHGFGADADIYYQFDENGRLAAYDPGVTFGARSSGGGGLSLNDTSQIISDLERNNLFSTASFDVTDSVRLFGELSLYRAKARELVSQSIYNVPDFPGVGAWMSFGLDNPFLHADDRATLEALGVDGFRLSRASRDLAMTNSESRSDIKRVVIGADGWFGLGERNVDWEVSLNHGRGDFRFFNNGVHQQNFINAINVTRDASGAIVCDSSVPGTVADAACVPLNLFGERRMSPEALAYVTRDLRTESANRQTVFNANATVGLFDLPGGEVKANIGYEQRRESASFTPSEFEQQGLGRSVPIPAISGSYRTHEGFAEVLAPVFGPGGNFTGMHRLDLTLKARRVNNSLAGNFNAWTYGLQWEPVEGVQVRGNKTRSFRAPAIVELFQPVTSIYPQIPEACTSGNIGRGTNPAQRRQNCDAFFTALGIDGANFVALDGSREGTSGGNPDLRNEQADSWTAGIVLQPAFVRGLTIAADYYRIALTDEISALNAANIVNSCFDNAEFNTADVLNANIYCSMLRRNEAGQATFVETTRFNGPLKDFKGWTGEVRYHFDLGQGRVNLGFLGYFPQTLTEQVSAGLYPTELAGSWGSGTSYAKRQYQWSAGYAGKHWSYGVNASYKSATALSVNDSPEARAEARDFYNYDSFTMWDGFVGYRFNEQVRVNLAVQNLRNQIGPFPYVQDALGRRFMLTTRFSF